VSSLSDLVSSIQDALLERYAFELISTPPNPDFSAVQTMFDPFLQLPDPRYYTPHIEQLRNALGCLQTGASSDPFDHSYPASPLPVVQPALGSLLQSGDAIPAWRGVAADNFRNNYLNRFTTCVPNDYTLVAMLKATLEAHQATFQAAHNDIMSIATDAQYAMSHYGTPAGSPASVVLTVVAAVTSVITAPLGGEVAIGVAAVGAAASLGASATQSAPAPAPTNAFSAQWAYQVIAKMQAAVASLSTQIDLNLVAIGTALEQTLGTLGNRTAVRDYFEPPAPDLTGFTSGSTR
jgi:hypothetical protein